MSLAGRHLITIDDFNKEEINAVLDLASEMNRYLDEKKLLSFCRGRELYTLFYEPSTRTRSSFETAMHRLGGTVVSHAEAQVTSSVAKGETIADTVRVLEKYADIIVMRHPLDGSTRLAADHSSVPVISGGDGAHEHPTQTLLDLYTIKKEKGAIKGKHVALCGDLRHGRTVHSLAIALARFGAEITCIAPSGFDLPEHIKNIIGHYGGTLTEYTSENDNREGFTESLLANLDVLYFTRLQRERFSDSGEGAVDESYLINQQLLDRSGENALIMHPLPRINELDYKVDQDKRAAYFRQAGYGVPVRMALIALLTGAVEYRSNIQQNPETQLADAGMNNITCSNRRCVTGTELYISHKFKQSGQKANSLVCYYCQWPAHNE